MVRFIKVFETFTKSKFAPFLGSFQINSQFILEDVKLLKKEGSGSRQKASKTLRRSASYLHPFISNFYFLPYNDLQKKMDPV